MTEKRVLLATLLSVVFLAFYTKMITPRMNLTAKMATSALENTTPSTSPASVDDAHIQVQHIEHEDVISIESQDLIVKIGTLSGTIRTAALKAFRRNHGPESLQFGYATPLVQLWPGGRPLTWKIKNQSESQAILEGADTAGTTYELSYVLDAHNPLVSIALEEQPSGNTTVPSTVSVSNTWMKGDQLSDRSNRLEIAIQQQAAIGAKPRYFRFTAVHGKPRNVPRGTILLALAERHFCQAVRFEEPGGETTVLPSASGLITALTKLDMRQRANGTRQLTTTIYLGPRDYFYLKKAGFEGAFPTGIFAQIGLILLMFLSWLAGLTHNYGVAIILFSVCVTCMMAPFTLMGFRSMRKMQALKPHMDRIVARHGGDQQKASPEIIALFKEHRVSPISGCLPVLLQLPIFFALIQAISHYVEFRGKTFLWIQDLSLPDQIFHLPISVPIFGNELNLLPVLTALAMFFQTRFSQKGTTSSSTDPSTKMMSGPMMPILFGVMFYQVPSALVLYWLTNSLMSMVWMRVAQSGTTGLPSVS